MLLFETMIGRLEVVIEKHGTTGSRWFGWEKPSSKEIILDIGKVSLMFTNTGVSHRTPLKVILVMILLALTSVGASAGVTCLYHHIDFTGAQHP